MNHSGDKGSIPPGQRNVRRTSAPAISVVVASIRERELLERCLASLLPQCAEVNAEVVVARRASDRELEELRSGYQWISLVAGPRGAGIAELRAAGMAIATGDVVVIIEDDGEVSSDFLRRVTGLTAPPAPRSGTRGQGGT
jgi:glycosyltransferase involved in cell wall biosynthesis